MNPNQIIEVELLNIPLPRRMTPKIGYDAEQFVERNFNVGDRVKVYFKGEWYTGTVEKKYKQDNYEVPYILTRTDKKVDSEADALLEGFGLRGRVDNLRNIFYDEPTESWGSQLYKLEIRGKKAKKSNSHSKKQKTKILKN